MDNTVVAEALPIQATDRAVDGGRSDARDPILSDPKYVHFARIPRRICQCFDHFGASYDRQPVEATLLAYYLFIGVIDDLLDAQPCRTGDQILNMLERTGDDDSFDALPALTAIAVQRFQSRIDRRIRPAVLAQLRQLHHCVLAERDAASIRQYIAAREAVGRLTADISFHLISQHLQTHHDLLRSFLGEVGAVGCLTDSVLDLRQDERDGLLPFTPSLADHGRLVLRAFGSGARALMQHPRLTRVFLAALADNVRDMWRRSTIATRPVLP